MSQDMYDAIVVGARCAGSPTAMLLARQGYRVLVVDRADVPERHVRPTSSTRPAWPRCSAGACSTQVVAQRLPADRALLVRLRPLHDRGHPAARRRHLGRATPRGAPCSTRSSSTRRPHAGAEVRERFTVDEVLVEDGAVVGIRGHGADGATVVERARVVIGADGRNSRVAKAVGAESTTTSRCSSGPTTPTSADLPVDGFEIFIRPDRGWAAARPTTG